MAEQGTRDSSNQSVAKRREIRVDRAGNVGIQSQLTDK